MALEPLLGEIQIFAFGFAPRNWATCDGQILQISQNTALFSLLGTMYGGNGVTTFALPDLRGRVPNSFGQGPGLSNRTQGESAGEAVHTLTSGEIPLHTHTVTGFSSPGDNADPTGRQPATGPTGLGNTYGPSGAPVAMAANALTPAPGAGQPHENMQPYLVMNYCIAIFGIFPSRD